MKATESNALHVIAVGASAGGVEALKCFASGLPPQLSAAILVVLHMPTNAPSMLAAILARVTPLHTAKAVDGECLRPSTIRVAVPNSHLIVDGHRTVLSHGPAVNGHRPSIDTLFRSVASDFGTRAIGVVLSGMLHDGTLGLAEIRSRGGTTIAQSPADALFTGMLFNAIEAGVVQHQARASELGRLLEQLVDR